MVKACIFDWGGVLIDNPHKGFIRYYSEKLHTSHDELGRVLPLLGKEYSLGLSENEFWKKVYAQLSIDPAIPFPSWRDSLPIIFREKKKVIDTICKLRAKGKKIALLSNTEIPTAHYFPTTPYAHLFDVTVFSCVEKIAKPDPRIYEISLQKLGVSPSETVFIDDNKQNVEAAEKLGMTGIVFDDEDNVVKQLLALS